MPRKLLVFAALAVVGSMLALWLATRGSKSSESAARTANDPVEPHETRRDQPSLGADPANPANPADPARDPQRPVQDHSPRNSDPDRPGPGTVANVDRGTHQPPTEPPLEYTLPDGRRVRDFRDPANRKPFEVPPSIHPPGNRKIKPELTSLFTDEIIKGMHECGKAVPKDALGAKSRAEGQIVIVIQKEEASVTNAVFKVTELASAPVADAAKACVEQKALTVKVPAPGEADLDSYSINLSFAFP